MMYQEMPNQEMTAADIIRLLEMKPHPEGGYYKESWRDSRTVDDGKGGKRSASTLIYFLLDTGDVSDWHRVDAAEVWHWYAGAPLVITVSSNGHDAEAHYIGPDLKARQRPQYVVPEGWWQTATSLGAWTLVGCTVAPGFDFAGFELAPPGWRPTPRRT
jgi:uncharacterized protein